MERIILKNAPSYWIEDYNVSSQYPLTNYNSPEYKEIFGEVIMATGLRNYTRIDRNQNIYDLGQFFIREQLKIALCNGSKTFYRVRRFMKIKKMYLPVALQFNADYRRCGLPNQTFKSKLQNLAPDEIILVVQINTDSPTNDNITPDNSSDYFIEYIVYPH
ncbi:uncharacterized protein LOC126879420 [Diabrotica virgifera virgifera]|uniref:Uncharacterized protein n=1 Tax=Diabrotica virgifera virgifera TaxID=50390 RepID=A0ABM5JKC0_DIAVI|nr:uncharacterized protein LOC126879420 [Diabrotica virgifera virgifera]XP_050498387.1 uncharacterized protein LOC126879420 [Diabrotica virgifera virgifera]